MKTPWTREVETIHVTKEAFSTIQGFLALHARINPLPDTKASLKVLKGWVYTGEIAERNEVKV